MLNRILACAVFATYGLSCYGEPLLPNPNTCGAQFKSIDIHHGGNIVVTALTGAYTTTLDFDPRGGEVKVSTNLGPNIKDEDVNGKTFELSYSSGLFWRSTDFLKCRSTDECEYITQDLAKLFDRVQANLWSTGATKSREVGALACAKSIVLSTLDKALRIEAGDGNADLRQLTASQGQAAIQSMLDEEMVRANNQVAAFHAKSFVARTVYSNAAANARAH